MDDKQEAVTDEALLQVSRVRLLSEQSRDMAAHSAQDMFGSAHLAEAFSSFLNGMAEQLDRSADEAEAATYQLIAETENPRQDGES